MLLWNLLTSCLPDDTDRLNTGYAFLANKAPAGFFEQETLDQRKQPVSSVDLSFTQENGFAMNETERAIVDIARRDGDFYLEAGDFNDDDLKGLIKNESGTNKVLCAHRLFILHMARSELTHFSDPELGVCLNDLVLLGEVLPLSRLLSLFRQINGFRQTQPADMNPAALKFTVALILDLSVAIHLDERERRINGRPLTTTFSDDMRKVLDAVLREQISVRYAKSGLENVLARFESNEDGQSGQIGAILVHDDMSRFSKGEIYAILVHESVHAAIHISRRETTDLDEEIEALLVENLFAFSLFGKEEVQKRAKRFDDGNKNELDNVLRKGQTGMLEARRDMEERGNNVSAVSFVNNYIYSHLWVPDILNYYEERFKTVELFYDGADAKTQKEALERFRVSHTLATRYSLIHDTFLSTARRFNTVKADAETKGMDPDTAFTNHVRAELEKAKNELPRMKAQDKLIIAVRIRMYEAYELAMAGDLDAAVESIDKNLLPLRYAQSFPMDE